MSPALGLIAAHQFSAMTILRKAGLTLDPGICAVRADHLEFRESIDSVHIKGALHLIPTAACSSLLVLGRERGHLVPLSSAGVTITPAPAIGFRAAGLADIVLDCRVKKYAIVVPDPREVPDAAAYLAVALGAGDYLCRRIKEHAAGQGPVPGPDARYRGTGRHRKARRGQGHDRPDRGMAPPPRNAVRRSIRAQPSVRQSSSLEFDLLCSTIAALAYSPEPGSMGYDSGQVFGGFAYSEDDLLSRSYRDSALFRFLSPGYGAAEKLSSQCLDIPNAESRNVESRNSRGTSANNRADG